MNSTPLLPTPWIKTDKAWQLLTWRDVIRVRFEYHSQRMYLTPSLEINWEEGMFSLIIRWLMWAAELSYDFDPEYDGSDERSYPLAR